jgi:hypothetical protein
MRSRDSKEEYAFYVEDVSLAINRVKAFDETKAFHLEHSPAPLQNRRLAMRRRENVQRNCFPPIAVYAVP